MGVALLLLAIHKSVSGNRISLTDSKTMVTISKIGGIDEKIIHSRWI